MCIFYLYRTCWWHKSYENSICDFEFNSLRSLKLKVFCLYSWFLGFWQREIEKLLKSSDKTVLIIVKLTFRNIDFMKLYLLLSNQSKAWLYKVNQTLNYKLTKLKESNKQLNKWTNHFQAWMLRFLNNQIHLHCNTRTIHLMIMKSTFMSQQHPDSILKTIIKKPKRVLYASFQSIFSWYQNPVVTTSAMSVTKTTSLNAVTVLVWTASWLEQTIMKSFGLVTDIATKCSKMKMN